MPGINCDFRYVVLHRPSGSSSRVVIKDVVPASCRCIQCQWDGVIVPLPLNGCIQREGDDFDPQLPKVVVREYLSTWRNHQVQEELALIDGQAKGIPKKVLYRLFGDVHIVVNEGLTRIEVQNRSENLSLTSTSAGFYYSGEVFQNPSEK